MKAAPMLWFIAGAVLAVVPASAIDLRERSESGTKQFIVYSEDVRLRQRVVSFAESVKTEVLGLLNAGDLWKAPVVITLARMTTAEIGEPPARLRVAETQPGFKLEIQVKIGDDPAAVNLHKVLLRAVLLEFAYRRTGVSAGEAIVEPPWWLIEGLYAMQQRREKGADTALFRRLVEANKLPPIESFLSAKPDELGPTPQAVDRALALALLDLLVAQPDGRDGLARLLRDWPQSDGDPVASLTRHFPALSGGQTLQKWWTLSLARFAAADRYQGLTAAETEKALASLLQFEIAINKAGEKKTFGIGEFSEYLKAPGSRAVLTDRQAEFTALGTRAHALYRPVMLDYGEIFARLVRGKTLGVGTRLKKVEDYRRRVLQRTTQIADYLNWFEATQMPSRSTVFDSYLKAARELAAHAQGKGGPIGRYLDDLEQEF